MIYTIDDHNYETFLSFSGETEEVKKFVKDMQKDGYFFFNTLLPVPDELNKRPIIENGCYYNLILMALTHDPDIHFYGNIRDKMSRDNFYKMFKEPFHKTGIPYKSMTEAEFMEEFPGADESDGKENTIEDSINALFAKATPESVSEANRALKCMYKYGYATRYSWRQGNWGTPMDITGVRYFPNKEPDKHSEEALAVYTTGGNGQTFFNFIAKKYQKLDFEIIWHRLPKKDEHMEESSDVILGERCIWKQGNLIYRGQFNNKMMDELDELVSSRRKELTSKTEEII